MDQEPYSKETVEAIPLGQWALSIAGVLPWGEQDRVKRLSDTINTIMQSVDELGIGASRILRLVVVTSDYQGEVVRWTQQLRQEWKAPSELAVGKALTWGTGEPKSTYSVVVLAEHVAGLVLLDDETEYQSLAIRCLVHELAHVHDDVRCLCIFGPDKPPEQNDWIAIRRFIAKSTWGDFFAESVTRSYVKNYSFEEDISLGATLLLDAHKKVQQEVSTFRSSEGVIKVWEVAVDKLSGAFTQLGRSLGLLAADQCNGRKQLDQFSQSVGKMLPSWEPVVYQLAAQLRILANQEQWTPQSLGGLEMVIEQGFRAAGVHPKNTSLGLWVDIYPVPPLC